eukprot:2246247-Prymnesium_polylepis.1
MIYEFSHSRAALQIPGGCRKQDFYQARVLANAMRARAPCGLTQPAHTSPSPGHPSHTGTAHAHQSPDQQLALTERRERLSKSPERANASTTRHP